MFRDTRDTYSEIHVPNMLCSTNTDWKCLHLKIAAYNERSIKRLL